MSILPTILIGIILFFVIVGVFGIWLAVDGLAFALLICLYIFLRRPEQEQA